MIQSSASLKRQLVLSPLHAGLWRESMLSNVPPSHLNVSVRKQGPVLWGISQGTDSMNLGRRPRCVLRSLTACGGSFYNCPLFSSNPSNRTLDLFTKPQWVFIVSTIPLEVTPTDVVILRDQQFPHAHLSLTSLPRGKGELIIQVFLPST